MNTSPMAAERSLTRTCRRPGLRSPGRGGSPPGTRWGRRRCRPGWCDRRIRAPGLGRQIQECWICLGPHALEASARLSRTSETPRCEPGYLLTPRGFPQLSDHATVSDARVKAVAARWAGDPFRSTGCPGWNPPPFLGASAGHRSSRGVYRVVDAATGADNGRGEAAAVVPCPDPGLVGGLERPSVSEYGARP